MTARSASECRQLARTAAKGGGLQWGLADEAGYAAEWLLQNNLPLAWFAKVLSARDKLCSPNVEEVFNGLLHPSQPDKLLCPLISGVLISDLSRTTAGKWRIVQVAHPLFLVPFAARIARAQKKCVRVRWQGVEMIINASRSLVVNDEQLSSRMADVSIFPVARKTIPSCVHPQCKVPAAQWRQLSVLAARTYVPATDQSRSQGAGAGANDAD